jgi:hypothetical protein
MVDDWDFPEKGYFFYNFFTSNIFQTETYIENPSGENVEDIEKNNITKTHLNLTMDGRHIAVEVSVIIVFSL